MDELTTAQLEDLRNSLIDLRQELQQLLAATEEGSRPVDLGQPIGRVSRIDAIQQQNMVAANRRSNELRLKQVKTALSALEQEGYGYCKSCEEPIGFRRLLVRPEAPLCMQCQGRLEG